MQCSCLETDDAASCTPLSSGGHFAALEQPNLMLADLRAFVSTITEGGFHE